MYRSTGQLYDITWVTPPGSRDGDPPESAVCAAYSLSLCAMSNFQVLGTRCILLFDKSINSNIAIALSRQEGRERPYRLQVAQFTKKLLLPLSVCRLSVLSLPS